MLANKTKIQWVDELHLELYNKVDSSDRLCERQNVSNFVVSFEVSGDVNMTSIRECCVWEAAKESIKYNTNKEQREKTRYNEIWQSYLRPQGKRERSIDD